MTKWELTACVLFVIGHSFTSGAFAGRDGDASKNDSRYTRFTRLELRCFAKEQVPYGDSCYKLLTRGPCEKDEWLVLDLGLATLEEPQLVAVCAEKQCNNNDIFWPRDGYCYNVTEGDSSLCPQIGTYLHVDPFGEGICDCKTGKPYVRWFNSDQHLSFRCFEAYTKGPCREGHIVVKRDGNALCEKDLCNNIQDKDARYVFWEEDKRCYKLESRGPCHEASKFVINPETKTPTCTTNSDPLRLHLIDLPPICKTDHGGECVDEIQFSKASDKYTKTLIQWANEKKRKGS